MTNLKSGHFIKLSLSLLTAGALLLPAVSMADMTTTQTAPSTMMVPAADMNKEMGPMRKMMTQLNLTADQRAKIDTLMSNAQASFTQLRADEKANKDQLKNIMMGSNYDAAKVQAIADEQGKDVSKRIVARMKLQNDIYNVLTPAQQQQFNDMKAQKMAEKAAKQGQPKR